jgi:dUTP pyrophosphatase
MSWETKCPNREDEQHCNHWYDDEPCCACGDDAKGPDDGGKGQAMSAINVKIKVLEQLGGRIPEAMSDGAAGYDVFAAQPGVLIRPRSHELINLGIQIEIPPGYEAQLRPRSGLAAKRGITVLNAPGTIDSDYRGELKVILVNHTDLAVCVSPGDRVAQLVFAPVVRASFDVVDELDQTARGSGGMGSTGVR